MKSRFWPAAALAALFATAACGEDPLMPVSPSDSPFATQFTGLWNGTMQLSAVSGGECVGDDLRASTATGPTFDFGTVAITQKQSDVTAVVRSATTGLSCQYRGTASLAGFALSSESCDAPVLFRCSNGNARVLEPIGSTMTVRQSANQTTGIVTTSYNVFSDSTEVNQRKPIAGLTTQHQFAASPQ